MANWDVVFPSQEVVMRPPEVFVRALSLEEGARLKSISKRAKYQVKRQRAMIVLASATLMSAPEIAGLMRTDESHVRKVIHAFNETRRALIRLTLNIGAGAPRRRRPVSATGSSRSLAPAPTHRASRSHAGHCQSSRRTWPGWGSCSAARRCEGS